MRILIIDDIEDFHYLIGEVLTQELGPQKLDIATSVKAGIALLEQHNDYDLVVCDYQVGDGLGTDIFKYIQARDLKIPFILVTAVRASNIPELAGEFCFGFVDKMKLNDLRPAVRKALNPHKAQMISAKLVQRANKNPG